MPQDYWIMPITIILITAALLALGILGARKSRRMTREYEESSGAERARVEARMQRNPFRAVWRLSWRTVLLRAVIVAVLIVIVSWLNR